MFNKIWIFWKELHFFKKVSIFIILFFLSFGSIFIIDLKLGSATGKGEFSYELEISPGEGYKTVSLELFQNKLIHSRKYFHFLLYVTRNTKNLKQGVYILNNGMNASEIIKILVSGKVKTITFTVPEGFHNRQIADLLTAKKLSPSREYFLEAASNPEILKKYNIPASTVEGYLFPETYVVPYNYKTEQVIELMLKRFFKNLQTIPEAKDISPQELHEKVILASIVEREAKKKEEQPLIAGVFLKRLKINMPLESCATVQYLFEKPKKRLLEKDLEIVSPYNTYLNKGYPPGPISNPGLPAIIAAFRPIESENLFFLVKPDGSHHFSKTHAEHLEAKKKYIDVLYQ